MSIIENTTKTVDRKVGQSHGTAPSRRPIRSPRKDVALVVLGGAAFLGAAVLAVSLDNGGDAPPELVTTIDSPTRQVPSGSAFDAQAQVVTSPMVELPSGAVFNPESPASAASLIAQSIDSALAEQALQDATRQAWERRAGVQQPTSAAALVEQSISDALAQQQAETAVQEATRQAWERRAGIEAPLTATQIIAGEIEAAKAELSTPTVLDQLPSGVPFDQNVHGQQPVSAAEVIAAEIAAAEAELTSTPAVSAADVIAAEIEAAKAELDSNRVDTSFADHLAGLNAGPEPVPTVQTFVLGMPF